MEVQGMVEIFSTSVEKYSVRYKYYIGDGDAKTFPAISAKNVYGDNFQVEKRECCGHTAKRFGKKARDLKTKMSGQKLPDGKGLSGQGRLTGKWLDKLQQFNGNAIRENCNSVQDMRNAIWATYFHYISTDKSPQHSLCPVGPNSWCKWQRAKDKGKLKDFKHKHDLPVECMKALKNIYQDLSEVELLQRCLGGYTQNSNESLNNNIWTILPKRTFSGFQTLKNWSQTCCF